MPGLKLMWWGLLVATALALTVVDVAADPRQRERLLTGSTRDNDA